MPIHSLVGILLLPVCLWELVFELRKKYGAPNFIRFPLFPGSLLLMEGAVQEDWLHCLPKDPDCKEERVNLTFRIMMYATGEC